MPRRPSHRCLAVTRPGLEDVTAAELRGLGLRVRSVQPGAVAFDASHRSLLLAVRWLRTATRVLVVAASFRATAFTTLEGRLADLDLRPFVGDGQPVAVRVRSEESRLYHTGAIAERVHRVLADAVGATQADDPQAPDAARVDVRVVADTVTVRIDAVGTGLDRRGWRLQTAKAPLAPTVAAAALRAIGWDGTVPLLDPLCGAGTIGIEAALLAAGREPTVDRDFAVQRWPSFAPGTWASAGVSPHPAAEAAAVIHMADRDAGAVAATRGNAGRAGVDVRLAQHALSAAPAQVAGLAPGWLLTNPPWGDRIGGDHDLRDLYAAIGGLLARLPGWRLGIITADSGLARATRVPLQPRWRTRIAGRPVVLLATPN